MSSRYKNRDKEVSSLHPNNPHKGRYDFEVLTKSSPELKEFLRPNPMGDNTIDFSDNSAVLCLNKALLKHYYNVDNWEIPAGYLCPPIPGRADYIHYVSDLIKNEKNDINVLDIGTGANCIYPIIGSQSFNWKFRATDIDKESVASAQNIVNSNANLKDKVEVILQENKSFIFQGIINEGDHFDLTTCNPPFHASLKEAQDSNRRKVHNLNKKKDKVVDETLNFGGQKAELWCPGGEMFFLKKMIKESVQFSEQVTWFTSLVSKSEHVSPVRRMVKRAGATRVKVIDMCQGQKISRIIAWTYRSDFKKYYYLNL